MPAMNQDGTVNSNPATPATATTTDSPSTMMKNVPKRSVRCETTTRGSAQRPPGTSRYREVDHHGDAPEHVAQWTGDEDRHQPEPGRKRIAGDVCLSEGASFAVKVVPGAAVKRDEERAENDVAGGERDPAAVARHHDAGRVDRDRRDREHPARLPQPEDQVIGVKPVGVQRVENPRPEDHHEQARKACEHNHGGIPGERGAELADCRDEHEIEEQLEPSRMPLLVRVGGDPRPRRLEAKRSARAQIPTRRRRVAFRRVIGARLGRPPWCRQR